MSIKGHILRRRSWGDRRPPIFKGGIIRGKNPDESNHLLNREMREFISMENPFLKEQSSVYSMTGRRK